MTAQDQIPERLGGYRLFERIGEGGMGVVFLAGDQGGRKVALKILHPAVAGEPTARQRLAREVETMRRVRSPYVAEVIDADLAGETPYIVTRFVPGRNLEAVVTAEGPLRGPALARLACGLADALIAVHAAGVVHRDVKPSNVMLLDGSPVVIDFGIAQGPDATRLTLTGMFMGTPGYLSPEVIEGRPSSEASDVHAWGATAAFAATGRPPFGTGPYETVFYRIVNGQPDLAGAPAAMLPLLASALAREPAHRPSAASLSAQAASLAPADLVAPVPGPGRAVTSAGGPASATLADRAASVTPADRADGTGPVTRVDMAPRVGVLPEVREVPGADLKAGEGALAGEAAARTAGGTVAAGDGTAEAWRSVTRRFDAGMPGDDFADVLPPVEYQPAGRAAGPPAPVTGGSGGGPGAAAPARVGRRRLLVFASGVAAAGVSVVLPVAGTLAALVLIILLGAGDRAQRRRAQRRVARGAQAGGAVLAVVTFPWHLARSLLASLLVAPAAAVVAALVGAVAIVAAPGQPLSRGLAYAAGALVAFYGLGPGSGRSRRQLSRIYTAAIRGRMAQAVAVAGMMALAAASIAAALSWPSFYWPTDPPHNMPYLARLRHLGLAGHVLLLHRHGW